MRKHRRKWFLIIGQLQPRVFCELVLLLLEHPRERGLTSRRVSATEVRWAEQQLNPKGKSSQVAVDRVRSVREDWPPIPSQSLWI